MYRRTLVLGLLTLPYLKPCHAAGWALITEEEFERDSAAPRFRGGLLAPAEAGAPIIEIEQPNENRPITAPVTIRLQFRAQGGASIDVTSFRATYGWLAIDITRRIIEHAQVNAAELVATNAEIPAGHHKVTLQISDNMHRVTSRTFEFTVVG